VARKLQSKETSEAPPKDAPKTTTPPSSRLLYLVMALVTVAILVGGYLFYHDQERQMRQRVEGGLSIVAQLKAEQIVEWRAARLVDANTLAGPSFTDSVARHMASPADTELRDKVIADLAIIAQAYPYQDILLTDVNGNVLLSLNESVRHLSDMTLAQMAVATTERKAVITDLHYHPVGNTPHLDVIAPLFPWGQDSPQAMGAVVFCIDPYQYLYPMLQSWPIPNETAETLLVERDDDAALFLNELRHQKDTALKLRIPLSRQEVPTVMAVLGKEGVVEGRDYRGVEVLAALKHIPDSPWYMVAKIDTSEAFAAWHFRAGIIIASVAGLMAAALVTIGLIWLRRQKLVYQMLYQAELELRQSQERFRALIEHSHDAITMLAADGTVLYDSPPIARILGYGHLERIGRSVFDFVHPDQRQGMADGFIKFTQQPGAVAPSEVLFLHKDGTPRWIEGIRSNLLHKPAIRAVLVNYRDVTERKRAEETVKHLNLTLRAIRNVNQLIAKRTGRDGLLKGACENFVTTRGYYSAWIALLDESGSLVTAAEAGLGEKFLQMIERLKRGELPDCGRKVLKKSGAVVIEDPSSACADCPLAKDYSGKRGMSVRLEYGGKVYGLMTISAPSGIGGEKEEQELFKEVAGDIAFALYSMEQERERKRAEEALRRSEQNFRDSIENSPLGIRIVTADGETLYANRALLDIWGYSSVEELEAVPRNQRYTPESYAEHQERKEKRRRGEPVPESYEISIVRKDGQVRHLAVSRGEVQWNGKRQFQVAYQDITDRKRADEALQQSEEKYRTILKEIEDSYFEVDLAGNLTFVNDSTCRSLRYSREELLGMNYRGFTAQEDIEHVYQTFNHVYRMGKPNKGFSWKVVRKDGTEGFVEATVSLLRSHGGEIIGFRGVGRDITERKKAEEERKQLEQKAQISSRLASVGEMAAGVAHEINNPLTGVIGYAQLLMDREDVPFDIRKDLTAINEGSQRMAGIVKRLLAFSRQTKPERRYVDINELIESTLALRDYHLKVNNIKVTIKLAPDVPETVADPGQIQQVLLNLIVNAETEMKLAHGRGKLTITTEKSDNIIKISVKDDGPGIKPELMDRIFDPFFTTREVGQGTGLGLSLCYGIIAEHNGKIYAESKPGKGATFIVELPVVTEAELPEPVEPVVEESEKVTKARILMVDDEQVVRELVKRVLGGEGYEVDTIDNAADALKMIADQRYNLILLDIKMPGMDGAELYRRIQKIAKSLARRVVFITGDIVSAATEKFLSETKVARIDKPFTAEQLRREVKRALSGGR